MAEPLLVYPPRRPALLALSTGTVGVAAGVLLLGVGSTFSSVAGWVLLVFFGLTLLGGIARTVARRPVLTVTDEGVHDAGSLVTAGLLRWSELGAVDLVPARRGGDVLVIGVRDPEEVLARAGGVRAGVARRQAGMVGSPVFFGPGDLDRPAAELRDAIQARRP